MESRFRCPREQTLHRKIGFLDPLQIQLTDRDRGADFRQAGLMRNSEIGTNGSKTVNREGNF